MNKSGKIIFASCGGCVLLLIITFAILLISGNLTTNFVQKLSNQLKIDNQSVEGSNISSNTDKLVNCTFNANDIVKKNPMYKSTFYTPVLDSNQSYVDLNDTGKRDFDLAEYKKAKDTKNLKEDFILRFEMSEDLPITANQVSISFQLCNQDNKTNKIYFYEPSSDKTYAITQYMSQGQFQDKKGTYRADAVLKVGENTYLIDRTHIGFN